MANQSPELRKLISEAIRQKRKPAGFSGLTLEQMAEDLKTSKARLSSYNTGVRIPTPEMARMMAGYFYKSDKDQQAFTKKIDDIRAALRQESARTGPNFLERLASKKDEKLKVGLLRCGPFAGAEDAFFNQVFERFFSLGGLNANIEFQDDLDLAVSLWNNELDLVYPYLAGVGRAVLLNFWTTPLRLSLGAVIHKDHARFKDDVEKVISGRGQSGLKDTRFRPIVVKGEVGALHCLQTLKYAPEELTITERQDASHLADLLIQESSGPIPSTIPVVVADEYCSFEVLKALTQKRSGGVPVIELSTRENARENPARRELPQYLVSFACSRRQDELRKMLSQAFILFLSTEIQTTSLALSKLYSVLMTEVEDVVRAYYITVEKTALAAQINQDPHAFERRIAQCFHEARNWVLYSLSLDRLSIENYPATGMPWQPILKRARQIVQKKLADDDPKKIEEQIEAVANYNGRPFSDRQFLALCRIFDVESPLTAAHEAQREYVYEDRKLLLKTIQNALRGKGVPSLWPERKIVDPGSDRTSDGVITGFLGEIQTMYRTRDFIGHNDANTTLTKILADPLGKTFTKLMVAWHGSQHKRYIASACLISHRELEGEKQNNDLEVCYLWVIPLFRRLKIARHIIYEAQKYAVEKKYHALVVRIPALFFEGILYFEKLGFQPRTTIGDSYKSDPDKPEVKRVVLEYSTAEPFPEPKDED